jgi:hypothetical protein
MIATKWKIAAAAGAAMMIAACQQQPGSTTSTGASSAGTTDAGVPAATGTTTTAGSGAAAGTGTSVPNLVNVNLQNVLNNLSVALKINQANVPVNAQVPIDVAANVCGVSVNVLAAAVASGKGSCTAVTTSPQLTQAVQQQLSAGSGTQTSGTTPPGNMI